MTWQPIESAPKDGTVILGWRKGDAHVVTYFDFDEWHNEEFRTFMDQPTHWMPLPPPPTTTTCTHQFTDSLYDHKVCELCGEKEPNAE